MTLHISTCIQSKKGNFTWGTGGGGGTEVLFVVSIKEK
jgi:hypothetical protein